MKKAWIYILLVTLILVINTAPLVIATAPIQTNHQRINDVTILTTVPDPNSVIVPQSYQEYHYVFYENHKTSNGHTLWIRAYHIYVYGTYTKTGVEAEWDPTFWGTGGPGSGYVGSRSFYVYINNNLNDAYSTTSNTYWPGETQTFYHIFHGGESLTLEATGHFGNPTTYISVYGTCTVPPQY